MNIALDTSKKAKALQAQFVQKSETRHLELYTFDSYSEEDFEGDIQALLDALTEQSDLYRIMQQDETTPKTGRWLATNLLSQDIAYGTLLCDRNSAGQITESIIAYIAGKATYSEIGNRCRLFANDPQWDDGPSIYSKAGVVLDTGSVTSATFGGYVFIVSRQQAAVIWGSDED